MKRWLAGMLLALFAFGVAAAAACSSEKAAVDAPATMTNDQGWPRVEGLRGVRYCEVVLARIIDARLNGEVWNTYGLNECPPDQWGALDTAAIKAERGVVAVLLNGPRYFLMDAIEKKPAPEERRTTTFGTLEMFLGATVDIGPIPPNLAPYTERRVARDSVFEFASGAEIYELTTPEGGVYVMQSYSRQNDPSLTEADLAGLAARITPPPGWTYRARTLDSTLRVRTPNGDAVVIQDDLSNTYQLIEPAD